MTTITVDKRYEPGATLDTIHDWVAAHAGQAVYHAFDHGGGTRDTSYGPYTLLPPERERVSYGRDSTEYAAVVVSTRSHGIWNDTYANGGPHDVDRVQATERELRIERRGRWRRYRLAGDATADQSTSRSDDH